MHWHGNNLAKLGKCQLLRELQPTEKNLNALYEKLQKLFF